MTVENVDLSTPEGKGELREFFGSVEPAPNPAEHVARRSPRCRARLVVEVDLDPVPGWGNCAEDWRAMLARHLTEIAGHYHPIVFIEGQSSGNCTKSCYEVRA